MKLINKFLTALAPVAMVGVITPTLVSCNKDPGYSFIHGQNLNCLDPNDDKINFVSIDAIAGAVVTKVNVEPRDSEITIEEINATLSTDNGFENVYYDLIASYAITQKIAFKLSTWNEDGKAQQQISFVWSDPDTTSRTFTNAAIEYAIDGNGKVILKIDSINPLTFPSYTYKDITF